ncbi:MAG: DNA repair protein RecN [Kiloniellales bacterium]
MLVSLSVRDVVLIDRLDLTFQDGLCVLTGETGAGKSILLDALGLALGNRAEAGLLRPGSKQALVTARFEVGADHPALRILADQGLDAEEADLVLRRTLGADGRSRAFINDQPVSVGLLRRLGDVLVEVQGQFEQRGLLDPTSHRELLDAYAGLDADAERVAGLWRDWREAVAARGQAKANLEQARRDEAFLRHAVEELDTMDPKPGEETALAEQRALLMNAGRIVEAMNAALGELSGGDAAAGGAEPAIAAARRALERAAPQAGGRLDGALGALDRAALEVEEALGQLHTLSTEIDQNAGRLEAVEERLFGLRDLARKHGTEVDRLPALRGELAARLSAIDDSGARLSDLEGAARAARQAYREAAESLSAARGKAVKRLDTAVARELPPLKLEKAVFYTRVERLEESAWGPHGLDRVAFEATTNPGSPRGPIARIASGGELARFLLALKLVLAEVGPRRTLVFDEVDAGVGGATADAIGERLARLTRDRQVLVVTHSPQVGARGAHHWRVHKEPDGKRVATRVSPLSREERREEIARMLAGAEVTDEARAAAKRLIEAGAS